MERGLDRIDVGEKVIFISAKYESNEPQNIRQGSLIGFWDIWVLRRGLPINLHWFDYIDIPPSSNLSAKRIELSWNNNFEPA